MIQRLNTEHVSSNFPLFISPGRDDSTFNSNAWNYGADGPDQNMTMTMTMTMTWPRHELPPWSWNHSANVNITNKINKLCSEFLHQPLYIIQSVMESVYCHWWPVVSQSVLQKVSTSSCLVTILSGPQQDVPGSNTRDKLLRKCIKCIKIVSTSMG